MPPPSSNQLRWQVAQDCRSSQWRWVRKLDGATQGKPQGFTHLLGPLTATFLLLFDHQATHRETRPVVVPYSRCMQPDIFRWLLCCQQIVLVRRPTPVGLQSCLLGADGLRPSAGPVNTKRAAFFGGGGAGSLASPFESCTSFACASAPPGFTSSTALSSSPPSGTSFITTASTSSTPLLS